MMNKRPLVKDKIGVLLLVILLPCGANGMSRGRIGSRQQESRLSGDTPAIASAAKVSSDGLIAFSADDQIYIMNADGSDLRRLTDGAPGESNRYPTFSPDGSRLAFINHEARGSYSLCIIGIDGSGLQHLVSRVGPLGEPAWSPDGSRIAFIRGYDLTADGAAYLGSCSSEIYAVDVFTRKTVDLTRGAGGTDPSWSPDGTRLAFSSYRDGNYEIYTMNSNGDDLQRLTYTDEAEAEPAWSPDGKQIAYAAHLFQTTVGCGFIPTGRPGNLGNDKSGIYVMETDGSQQTELAITAGGIEPTWSPDGTSLAFIINNGMDDSQVYVTEVKGQSLTKLTSDSSYKTSLSWSNASR